MKIVNIATKSSEKVENIGIDIVKLTPRRSGDEVEATVRIYDELHEDFSKLTVSSKMLFDIGNIGVSNLPYSLTREQFDGLTYSASLWECIKKALDLLSYGDNTKSALIRKLRQRGFDKYLSEDAAEAVAEMGYINESRILERTALSLANGKLYGKSRIRAELMKKGISSQLIREELDGILAEVDFEANLTKLLRRKCDPDMISDRAYREKLYAAMYRYGYSVSETREALEGLAEE